MSRIGKKPILLPPGVEVKIDARRIEVKGPKGTLTHEAHPWVRVVVEENDGKRTLVTSVDDPDDRMKRAYWGTTRSILENLVEGVTEGFKKTLEVVGVGYKVNVQGKKVVLDVGFSHQVEMEMPEGILAKAEKNVLTIEGIDKALVGEVASNIRKVKKPEPYKGKGIKYIDEIVRRKVGKAAKTAE